jgi:ATP-dependent exoDNAse (exonuclease V) beta subunit
MSHISFSELKYWDRCPYYHKVNYIDGLRTFEGNLFTAFGSAVHHVCEKLVLKEILQDAAPGLFTTSFFSEVEKLPNPEGLDQELFENMLLQGTELATRVLPALSDYFGKFELVGVEEKLYEEINQPGEFSIGERKFKGFIDLIIKTSDGKYNIIDWKTCGWGWDTRRRSDPMVTYQLTLYKHFFAKKHEVDPKQIETYFALLKRTAKKDRVEIFRVTSGPKKTDNALKLLHKALYNIENENFVKNRLSCKNCELYKTEHCP